MGNWKVTHCQDGLTDKLNFFRKNSQTKPDRLRTPFAQKSTKKQSGQHAWYERLALLAKTSHRPEVFATCRVEDAKKNGH